VFFDSGVDSASISVDVRRRLLFCFDDAVVGADALRCGCAVLDSASLIVGSLSVSALSIVSSSGADSLSSLSSPDDTPRLCIVGADAECVA
jgi:hypothetical protein